MKIYHEGSWFFDPAWRALRHVKAGEYEESTDFPEDAFDIHIGYRDIHGLVEELEKSGWLRPKINEPVRKDDVALMNKMLDIIAQERK